MTLDSAQSFAVPFVYVVLGTPGAGRSAVVSDLIRAGLDPAADRAHVVLPEGASALEAQAAFPTSTRWTWDSTARDIVAASGLIPSGATHVFFFLDGTADPVDQLEALKPFLAQQGLTVTRVFTVINCRLAEKHAELAPWFAACVHFSDVVLLSRREGVANKWMSTFRRSFEEQCMPCIFEFVKDGKVRNPALLLDVVPRRLSQYFDASEWDGIDLADIEIGESEDEDGETVRPLASSELDPDDQPPVDPYLERKQNGSRVIMLPDIRLYLNPAS